MKREILTIEQNHALTKDVFEMRLSGDVSAITKPGQYILAAEAIPEEEPGEDTHEGKLGDVNHDTKINAKDATLILQKSVGVLKPTAKFCEECAEVSGDGKLNAKDSTLILQFSVGLRDNFPGKK